MLEMISAGTLLSERKSIIRTPSITTSGSLGSNKLL
jgi:hypothetical protein